MLNLPGHHSTASIVAEVVTGDGRYDSYAMVHISDCDRKISLEFSPTSPAEHENDLHKVDTMIDALRTFRRALAKEQKRWADA